jgi:O-antigen/teichoic acid export membrane protein
MSKLIKYSSLPLATLVGQALRLGLFAVLARNYTLSEVGYFHLALTLFGVFGFLGLPGFGHYARQRIARGGRRLFFLTLRYRFLGSLLASPIFFSLAIYFEEAEQSKILIILALLFPFAHGLDAWREWFIGEARFERLSQIILLQGLASNLFCISIAFMGVDYEYVLLTLLCINFVVNAIALFIISSYEVKPRFRLLFSRVKIAPKAFWYGTKVSLISWLNDLGNHLDKIILFAFVSPEALALYAVAEKIPEAFKGILQIIRTYLYPQLSKKKAYDKQVRKVFGKICVITFIALVPLVLVLPFVIRMIFGPTFEGAIFPSQCLMASLILSQISQLNTAFILSRIDSRSFTLITGGSNAAKLIFGIILIPIFGISGAVIATVLYRGFTVVLTTLAVATHKLDSHK